ncbi:MAG: hypothetical protein ISR61_03490 [Desulfobacteraceae bacterium]|uniref:Uncharacterized protein n=1 Tax=Candidatus Desulfacyla euxinica TaxID=2841693 RepID=A0A8J6MYT7_9DELT|nr:hypothetical protein [Candidatus Desulfacyla euxinica]MBL6977986.1 hypothetical protein [Desulfobacteraceae bacterium]
MKMPKRDLPENYKGYSTEELLDLWQQLRSPQGISEDTPTEKISAMSSFLRDYRFGVHQHHDKK